MATHLAGANKVNSVNFSTCLHRLARFASSNNNNNNYYHQGRGQQHNNRQHQQQQNNKNEGSNNSVDERTKVLSDPRFALLVCSMAEMACGIDSNVSVKFGNDVIQHWTMENQQQQQPHQPQGEKSVNVQEAAFESGKRDAVAAKEAMSRLSIINTQSNKKYTFSSRECSNVCWALAKLRMAPPKSAIPIGRGVVVEEETSSEVINGSSSGRQFTSMD